MGSIREEGGRQGGTNGKGRRIAELVNTGMHIDQISKAPNVWEKENHLSCIHFHTNLYSLR